MSRLDVFSAAVRALDAGQGVALAPDVGVSASTPRHLRARVIVFGLGHVARMLGPHLHQLGFFVVVCDDNDTEALSTPPDWADEVIESFDAVEIERRLGGFSDDDYALIITRDHAIDQKL